MPPDMVALSFGEPRNPVAARPIDLRLLGDDVEALKAASGELLEWLRGYDGLLDLSDDLRLGKPELRVRLREGALVLGLTASEVARQLRAAFYGRRAGEFQVGAEDYEIDIRLSGQDRDSLADLGRFTVTLPGGEQVPLHTVATLTSERGYGRIHRINGRRAVTVQGERDSTRANAGEVLDDTKARFLPGLLARYPGVSVGLEGQARQSEETGSSLGRNFLVGLAAIFLLLSFQFRSYIEPLVVMASIPVGLLGVVVGHLALDLELSMPSLVGYVSLAGVVVNNAIVLVTFIKIHRRGGESAEAASRRAARQRFRAILLTSLTTVAGVLPLLMETSLQAQVLIPLVTSLAFGLGRVHVPGAVPGACAVFHPGRLRVDRGRERGGRARGHERVAEFPTHHCRTCRGSREMLGGLERQRRAARQPSASVTGVKRGAIRRAQRTHLPDRRKSLSAG